MVLKNNNRTAKKKTDFFQGKKTTILPIYIIHKNIKNCSKKLGKVGSTFPMTVADGFALGLNFFFGRETLTIYHPY